MKSMTGYGTAEGRVGKGRLFVEIKSVNHRFSEINVKIPGRMGILESHIRNHLRPMFARGKVDVFFKEKEPLFGGVTISADTELAHRYQRIIARLKRELNLSGDSDLLQIVGLDRILKVEEKEGSYERLWGQIVRLLDQAAGQVTRMRSKEGTHIFRDQRKRLVRLGRVVRKIRSLSDRAMDRHLKRLRRKVGGAGAAVDEQRLQMEVAYLGGRQDIAEELVRLASHIKQYAELIRQRGPVGRRLDFLTQEMHREINTVGAKAADAAISQLVVDCKAEMERLKEQIQNVE
jgi:uncharacterized protein (TIGR00255 family)